MRYYMLNKPKGCVTAGRDVRHPTVMDCFPEDVRCGLHPIGRLDIDTEGLLVVTDDGGLDNRIMQPTKHIKKCYRFRALGDLDETALSNLREGIVLYGSDHIACPAEVTVESRCRVCDVISLLPPPKRPKWMKNPNGCVVTGRITITEGRKHQVKLMLHSAGCHVFTLERLSMGGLVLDPTLPRGAWRELTVDEVNMLCEGYLDENGTPTMPRNWRRE